METVWKTFQEWSSEGYTITKGSKAQWINGIPKFNQTQVSKRFNKTRNAFWDSWDDSDENYNGGFDDDEIISPWDFGDN